MPGHIADYFWTTLPHFLGWFLFALLIGVAYLAAYVTITPHKEFTLIKAGNSAAAIQLILSTLGFALPLYVAISHSVVILDALYWSAAALVVQLVVFFIIARVLLPGVEKRIEDNCSASGITIGGLSLVAGLLMAACMVP